MAQETNAVNDELGKSREIESQLRAVGKELETELARIRTEKEEGKKENSKKDAEIGRLKGEATKLMDKTVEGGMKRDLVLEDRMTAELQFQTKTIL